MKDPDRTMTPEQISNHMREIYIDPPAPKPEPKKPPQPKPDFRCGNCDKFLGFRFRDGAWTRNHTYGAFCTLRCCEGYANYVYSNREVPARPSGNPTGGPV